MRNRDGGDGSKRLFGGGLKGGVENVGYEEKENSEKETTNVRISGPDIRVHLTEDSAVHLVSSRSDVNLQQ